MAVRSRGTIADKSLSSPSWPSAALRQARRVAAGRYYLRLYDLDHLGAEAIEPHRSIVQSLFWILARTDFSLFDRLRMLSVAVLLKGVTLLEMFRLRLGGNAERR